MTPKEIRQQTRTYFQTKHQHLFLMAVLPTVIVSAFSLWAQDTPLSSLFSLLQLFVVTMISISLLSGFRADDYDFKRDFWEEAKTHGWRYLGTALLANVYVFFWTLLFIIPGIIKSISYALLPYLLKDNTDLSYGDAITQSETLMQGQKWNFFKLYWGFYGWLLAAGLVVGTSFLSALAIGISQPGYLLGTVLMNICLVAFFTLLGWASLILLPRWEIAKIIFYEQLISQADA